MSFIKFVLGYHVIDNEYGLEPPCCKIYHWDLLDNSIFVSLCISALSKLSMTSGFRALGVLIEQDWSLMSYYFLAIQVIKLLRECLFNLQAMCHDRSALCRLAHSHRQECNQNSSLPFLHLKSFHRFHHVTLNPTTFRYTFFCNN